jgi:ketosteroid isomerase-like protein
MTLESFGRLVRLALLAAIVCSGIGSLFGQAAPDPPLKPEEVVREWFERWNALDGSDEATNRLLLLYRPNAFHQIGANEKQIGEVLFEGQEKIRKMIDDFAKANTEISFRIQPVTANEKAVELMHVAEGPWGGQSVAVQYRAAYTTRNNDRRWMNQGAAFFQIQDGKIRGVRFYMARDELMEVFFHCSVAGAVAIVTGCPK